MTPDAIHEKLLGRFGDDVVGLRAEFCDPFVEVRPARLHEICVFLRDDAALSFDFLRCLTGVDRADGFEIVYHLHSYSRRHAIVLKVRLGREDPLADSVHDVWPVANWYEREAYDLLGIGFAGHPNLVRLLLPEDWAGHPLRKDYVRPDEYHGIRTSREGTVPISRLSVGGRPGFTPAMHKPKAEEGAGFMRLNMGPHHPATHGVLNFLLETDGEILRRAIPDVGYLHRGIEKLAEGNTYIGTMPYTDRIDYLGAMFVNHAWALAVERLAGIEVPRRGEYCRVIGSELNRIASHLIATGALAMDLGAYTPFIHWLREREKVNDIMERICGARLTFNYFRFGGVARDVDETTVDMILAWLDHFVPIIDEFDRLISNNEIFVQRLANVATVSASDAIAWGLAGPNLRASGVNWDLRRDEPYSVYPEMEFDVVVGRGWRGAVGDSYDRFVCRVLEMRESARILRQACRALPPGDFWAKPKAVKPAPNEVYARVESVRGELGAYLVSNGTDKPHRARFRTGSFTAMPVIEHLSPGLMIGDLVALIGSLDVIAPEVDR
jgi:NADH-quinone oxidoreductase subunit D